MANGEQTSQIMDEKKPAKGILKSSSSFDKQDKPVKKSIGSKATKFDEMNIIATLHPADKDYGHMKIEEPKTPYNYDIDEETDGGAHNLDINALTEKLTSSGSPRRKSFSGGSESEDSDVELTPEELARRTMFKSKRKMHYNEFKVVEFARKLIKADEDELDQDDCDDDDDEDPKPGSSSGGKDCIPSLPKSKSRSPSPTTSNKK